jgi:hypothetical protein
MDRVENGAANNSVDACVFVAVETFLPSSLCSNENKDKIYHLWDGFRPHDILTKFHEALFRLKKIVGGDL